MKKFTISLLTMALLTCTLQAKVIYVTTDGNNTNDGSTWDKAVADLQQAHDLAAKGDQIWMAGGTYDLSTLTPTTGTVAMVLMKDGVDIYGGFKKGDTSIESREQANAIDEPWNFVNTTVITASNPLTVRPFDRVDKAQTSTWKSVMDGIKFYDIETNNARILYLNTGTTFQNCWMDNCRSSANGGTYVYMERGGMIQDCLFENCTLAGTSNGASVVQLRGSVVDEAGLSMDNCTFRNNAVGSVNIYNTAGGYPENNDNPVVVTNCKLLNNTAGNAISISTAKRLSIVDNCLIEGNTGTSTVTTNYAGSLMNISGEGAFLTNCIIRNNKNNIGAEEDYKHSLIFVNTYGMISNSLIANNECALANLSVVGTVLNSTVVNNTGIIQVDGVGTLMNSIILNNTPVVGTNPISILRETGWIQSCALASEGDVSNPSGADFFDAIYTDMNTLLAPTTFVGNATNETDKIALVNANFSLAENSVCLNAGINEPGYLYGDGALVETIKTYFDKDLAKDNRFSSDDKISIGAYQGSALHSLNEVDADIIANVYASSEGIVIDSSVGGVAEVYTLTGVKVISAPVALGTQVMNLERGQIYIVRLTTEGEGQTTKIFLK